MKSYLTLFRALIPSWGFFDDFGAGTRIYLRHGKTAESLGDWQPALQPLARKPWHLFINPLGSERLLTLSVFDRLAAESQDYLSRPNDFSSTVTYKICEQSLRSLVTDPSLVFQFKLSEDNGTTHVFVSKVHRA